MVSVIIALSCGLAKTILKRNVWRRVFSNMEKKKTSAFEQKRLNVLGAVEVSNTRDTSRILSIKKGIYCFVISLTLFGVAVLTR